MTIIINREITDLAFYYWINGFPTSSHPIDWRRFLGFIITERRYRCKRYNTYEKFRTECLAYLDNLTESEIKNFWTEKQRVEDFLDDIENAEIPIQRELVNLNGDYGYIQQNIIDHKLYRTKITNEEYRNGGISPAEVKKRAKVKTNNN